MLPHFLGVMIDPKSLSLHGSHWLTGKGGQTHKISCFHQKLNGTLATDPGLSKLLEILDTHALGSVQWVLLEICLIMM